MKFNRKVVAGFTAVGLFLGNMGVAHADNVQASSDVLSSSNQLELTAGAAGKVVRYAVGANGTGSEAGADNCDVSGLAPMTLAISGLPSGVTASPSSLTFTSCGASQEVTYAAASTAAPTATAFEPTLQATASPAGAFFNLNPAKVAIKVLAAATDSTPPVITPTITGTKVSNDWYTSNVKLTWSVTDAQSAISSSTGCGEVNVTVDQAATTYTCTATSGGGTDSKTVSIKRDATKPTNVTFVGGPAAGVTYYLDDAVAQPTCTADDAGSGMPETGGCHVTGFKSGLGTHAMTATATDLAGNVATATREYTIAPWTATGFHAPVKVGLDDTNNVKGGSTVPLKFNVLKGATEVTDVAKLGSAPFSVARYDCDTSDEGSALTEVATAGSTQLRYGDTQFIQNWKTPTGSNVCYRVTVTPGNGAKPIVAQFKVTK